MEVKLVVAHDSKRGIGNGGEMPWRIPGEMKWLANLTRRTRVAGKVNALIMGRITFDSIPQDRRPLAGRLNIVVSTTLPSSQEVPVASSLEAAIDYAGSREDVEDVFIFGGASIYHEALSKNLPTELLVSVIPGEYECDSFFPVVPPAYTLGSVASLDFNGVAVSHCRYSKSD